MTAEKGLALPIGTKVRRKSNGEIIEKDPYSNDRDGAGFYYMTPSGRARGLFKDDEWELIEEEKERLPKQGDEIEVLVYNDTKYEKDEFVCFHKGNVVVYSKEAEVYYSVNKWRFQPEKITMTLAEAEEKMGLVKGTLIIKD